MSNKIMKRYALVAIFFVFIIIASRFYPTNISLIILSTATAIPFTIMNIALLRNIFREISARRIFVKRIESLSVYEREILDTYIKNQTWSLSYVNLSPNLTRLIDEGILKRLVMPSKDIVISVSEATIEYFREYERASFDRVTGKE